MGGNQLLRLPGLRFKTASRGHANRRPDAGRLSEAGPALTSRALLMDGLLAAILLILAMAQLFSAEAPGLNVLSAAGASAMIVPVAWRRAAPFAAVAVAWPALLIQEGFGADITSHGYAAVIALVVIVYSVARWRPRKPAVLGLVVALVCVWASIPFSPTGSAPDYAFTGLITLAPWLAGLALRDRQLRIEKLALLYAELEHKRDAETRLAVLAERDRLAREMHDVLTHTLSMMVVQLGGIQQILDTDPVRAANAIAEVRASGKDALAELRTALAGERLDGHGLDAAVSHARARLPALFDSLRRAGMSIDLRDTQDLIGRSHLPSNVDHTAFRIIQESLTNALKHSPGSSTSVTLIADRQWLHLNIENDRPPCVSNPSSAEAPRKLMPHSSTQGVGLRGMAERARLCGGRLSSGPAPGGGYLVKAHLPLEAP